MNKRKIIKLLADSLKIEVTELQKYDENSSLVDLGLDSLGFVQFIVNLEMAFGIEVNDEDLILSKLLTLNDLYLMLSKYFKSEDNSRKVIILDCDNVLWNGVAGEEDINVPEAFALFHKELTSLRNHGILLCLCSKNNAQNIQNAFRDLKISLKKEDIVCAKIGTKNKAESIKEIAGDLNLSLDSFVFIDDSDYEIGLVHAFLPDVKTIKVEEYDSEFFFDLQSLFKSFNNSTIDRTKMYHDQKEREKEKLIYKSVDEYNQSLQTECICEFAEESQAERISELSFRTNQFNLSGEHYSVNEILGFLSGSDYKVFILQAKDKYGDMGIVGAAVVGEKGDKYIIKNFMLSCRVFDRGFEYILLDTIRKCVKGKMLYGIYNKTEKNEMRGTFYADNRIKCIGNIV